MVLLEHCPSDTTRLFIDYFTGAYVPKRKTPEVVDSQAPQSVGTTAIQTLASLIPLPYSHASKATASPAPASQTDAGSSAQAADVHSLEPPSYEVPSPRKAFSSFVDHPDCFVTFLEACRGHAQLSKEDQVDVVTTLFEMYLHFAQESRYEEREQWSAKARKIIDGGEVKLFLDVILPTTNVAIGRHRSVEHPSAIPSIAFS